MKINQIIVETTTAGSVATVSNALGAVQSRPDVKGLKPIQQLGSKKKGPYANSLNEGAMKQLSMDLKTGPDGLTDQAFQAKYKMTKQEARKELASNRKENKKPQPVSEAELSEDDIILVPGQGRKLKSGFVPHGKSRVDHEVEMARSDLLSAAKNAEAIFNMIESTSEDEGLEGWVQEKIIKANDYLNSVREYLEGQEYQGMAEGNNGGHAGSAKVRYTGGMHGTYEPTKSQSSSQAHLDAAKYHDNEARVLSAALNNPKALSKDMDGYKNQIQYHKNKAEFHNQRAGQQDVAEGAKVDRMVKHIAHSEKKLGKTKDEAENIAWATLNKRGMLDNKNKK